MTTNLICLRGVSGGPSGDLLRRQSRGKGDACDDDQDLLHGILLSWLPPTRRNAAIEALELYLHAGGVLFDTMPSYFIEELNGPRRMDVVRDGLGRRGLSAGEVEKVMGGNLLRLYRDVIG